MIIGIHSIAAFKERRTGVEEYAYQLIRHLAILPESENHRFLLYADKFHDLKSEIYNFPDNFEIRTLRWPIMWTQMRLSMEMLKKECDVLFIPAHVMPIIHLGNSIVTIHGLEYEYFPQYYSLRFRQYLRFMTKYAARNARKIIVVSENTKRDLIDIYGISKDKILTVYHGALKFQIPNYKLRTNSQFQNSNNKNYVLYIGRIELKKNITGIIRAFEIFKEKYKLSCKLVLIGPDGFGYETIKSRISNSEFKNDIVKTGYLDEKEKEAFLQNASMLLFPSFYEGFGMPILEAQTRGVPVITSNVSSMPEVGGPGALYVNPKDYNDIADKIYKLLADNYLRRDIINKGYENIRRFSWEKCAQKTLQLLINQDNRDNYN